MDNFIHTRYHWNDISKASWPQWSSPVWHYAWFQPFLYSYLTIWYLQELHFAFQLGFLSSLLSTDKCKQKFLNFQTFILTDHPNFRETWPTTSYLKSIDFWSMLCFTYLSCNALEYGLVLAFAHQDPMKINTENAVRI